MKYLVYVGLLLFVYIIATLDLSLLGQHLRSANWWLLACAFLLNIPMVYLKSYRWKKILSNQGIYITSHKSFSYYISSLYLGFITPGRVGEISRLYYLKKDYTKKNYGELLSSVVLDRLFDLYLLVILTIIGFLYLSLEVEISYQFLFLSLFFVAPYLVIKLGVVNILIHTLARKYSSKFHTNVAIFFKEFNFFIMRSLNLNSILYLMLLTIFSYTVFFLQVYLIATSINLDVDLITLIFIMAISNTLSLLPISISGIGTRDMVLIYFLTPMGYLSEMAVTYSSLIFLIFFAGCSLIGFFYFKKNLLVIK